MNSPEFSLMTLFTFSYISSTESPSTSAMEEIKKREEQGGRKREGNGKRGINEREREGAGREREREERERGGDNMKEREEQREREKG